MSIGMVQLLAIGFPGNEFRGEIIPELEAIREKGLARIIDLVFVYKDEVGVTTAIQFSDLSDEEKVRFGMTTGALLGLGARGIDGVAAGAEAGAQAVLEDGFGITEEDIEEIAVDVPDNSSALIILFEHLWSLPFKEAVINAKGMMLGNWIIQPELFVEMGAELQAERDARLPV